MRMDKGEIEIAPKQSAHVGIPWLFRGLSDRLGASGTLFFSFSFDFGSPRYIKDRPSSFFLSSFSSLSSSSLCLLCFFVFLRSCVLAFLPLLSSLPIIFAQLHCSACCPLTLLLVPYLVISTQPSLTLPSQTHACQHLSFTLFHFTPSSLSLLHTSFSSFSMHFLIHTLSKHLFLPSLSISSPSLCSTVVHKI